MVDWWLSFPIRETEKKKHVVMKTGVVWFPAFEFLSCTVSSFTACFVSWITWSPLVGGEAGGKRDVSDDPRILNLGRGPEEAGFGLGAHGRNELTAGQRRRRWLTG
nr:hypothetical protein CFP56_64575 [Quercus suber]